MPAKAEQPRPEQMGLCRAPEQGDAQCETSPASPAQETRDLLHLQLIQSLKPPLNCKVLAPFASRV